ncbi:MAG TPA: hypothetical protein VGO63_00545 [Candidatus Paceibacterota bacterium]|jgi:hypothetical protein|nr:hypothetical protein [Candidatus Paceibacterota bacterium]
MLILAKQRGFATLEILIAFTVVTLCIGAVILLVFSNQSLAIDSQTNIEAISKAGKMLEDARALSKQDFYSVVSIPAINDNIYQKTLSVEDLDSYTKRITSKISWPLIGGRNPSVEFTTLVTNIHNLCSQTLSGDWTNPKIINTAKIDIDSAASLTDVAALSGYAYITGDSSTQSKNDFYVVNTSNPVLPSLVGSLNTGPGLNSVSVSSNYAYVANGSINAQLQVIDITAKNSPTLYKNFKLPMIDSDAGTVGYSILYHSGKVYMGTKKNGKAGFHIIDVSDLSNIHEVGYLEVNNTINQIQVIGNYAYLASDDSAQELRVLNISTPANILGATIYNAPNTSGFGFGKSLAIYGNTLFLGRTFDANANNKELHVINISDITANPLPSTLSQKMSESVNAVFVKSSLVFMATNSKFQVRKTSDLSLYGTLSLPASPPAMDCSGDYFYMGVLGDGVAVNKDVLKIISSSP